MIYRLLATKYGWDANLVKRLTPFQQYMYLRRRQEDSDPQLSFDSIEELDAWMERRGRRG